MKKRPLLRPDGLPELNKDELLKLAQQKQYPPIMSIRTVLTASVTNPQELVSIAEENSKKVLNSIDYPGSLSSPVCVNILNDKEKTLYGDYALVTRCARMLSRLDSSHSTEAQERELGAIQSILIYLGLRYDMERRIYDIAPEDLENFRDQSDDFKYYLRAIASKLDAHKLKILALRLCARLYLDISGIFTKYDIKEDPRVSAISALNFTWESLDVAIEIPSASLFTKKPIK